MGSLVDGINQPVDSYAPMLFDKSGPLAVPIAVGDVLSNPKDWLSVITAPTDHVIYRVGGFAGSFGGNPGVNGKPTTPAPGFGTVDV